MVVWERHRSWMWTHSIRQHVEVAAVGGKDRNLRRVTCRPRGKHKIFSIKSHVFLVFFRYLIKCKILYALLRKNHLVSMFLLIYYEFTVPNLDSLLSSRCTLFMRLGHWWSLKYFSLLVFCNDSEVILYWLIIFLYYKLKSLTKDCPKGSSTSASSAQQICFQTALTWMWQSRATFALGLRGRATWAIAQEAGCYRVSSYNLEFLLYSVPLILKNQIRRHLSYQCQMHMIASMGKI